MTLSTDLIDASEKNQTLITYTRCHGGFFENPYYGAPSLTFQMQKATLREEDDKLISTEVLPNLPVPYSPGKVYKLMNPETGKQINGATFTCEQAYAMLWSMMYATMQESAAEKKKLADAAELQAAKYMWALRNEQAITTKMASDASRAAFDVATAAAATAAIEAAQYPTNTTLANKAKAAYDAAQAIAAQATIDAAAAQTAQDSLDAALIILNKLLTP